MNKLFNRFIRLTGKKGLVGTLAIVSILLSGLVMTSCGNDEEEDGLWEPMKWKTDVSMDKDGVVSATAEGGTYVFNCTNYRHIWVSQVEQVTPDGKRELFPKNPEDKDFNNVATPWGKINAERDRATIELYPNESSQKRSYVVSVTAGDIFFHFTFNQAGR